jgi:hypothetical protein
MARARTVLAITGAVITVVLGWGASSSAAATASDNPAPAFANANVATVICNPAWGNITIPICI